MTRIEKQLRRMSPPAYCPVRPEPKPKSVLRLSHTVSVEGHGTIQQEAAAYTAWRKG